MRLAICEDDVASREMIRRMVRCRYGKSTRITVFESADALLEKWKKSVREFADIVLMDIQMEGTDGISAAKKIRRDYPDSRIIFLTGYLEYATEIFEADPVYFLVKPVSEDKLYAAIDKAWELVQEREQETITLVSKGSVNRVKVEDIVYVESERRTLTVHEKCRSVTVNMKLDEMESMLPDFFLRSHQSYLVNMKRIKRFAAQGIELYDGLVLPISRPRYAKAKEKFLQFLGEGV